MERRRHPRYAVDGAAKIIIPGGDALPARISNGSEGGAKLRVGWKGWLPKVFDLQDVFTGVRRVVQTVWVGLGGVGVRFCDPKSSAPQQPGFGRRR